MTYIEKFGFKSSGVALVLFAVYGFFVNLFIGIKYGFNVVLPDEVTSAATGPISAVTFSLFYVVSLLLVIAVTRFGTNEIDLSIKNSYLVRFTVRVIEVTNVMAFTMIGALLGMAIAAFLLLVLGVITVSPHSLLFVFALLILSVIYPVVILTISLFDSRNYYRRNLNIFSSIYLVFVVGLFWLAGSYIAIAYLGAALFVFVLVQMIRRNISWGKA